MRRIVLLTLLALAARCAVAQSYGRLQFVLQTSQGQAVAGGNVTVYSQPACGSAQTGLATLYSTANGGPWSGPSEPSQGVAVTDGNGSAFAYAVVQCYTVQYSSPATGVQTFIDQVPLSPASGGGAGSVGPGNTNQVAAYPGNGTSVAGTNSLTGITIDTATPTNLASLDTVTSIQSQLNLLSPRASPVFTGIPTGPTDPSCNANALQLTTEAYVNACSGSGGSGTVNSGTGGYFTYYPSTGTSVSSNASLDDGVTTANTVTLSNRIFAVNNPSVPSQFTLTPTTHAPTVVAGGTTLASPATVTTAGTYTLPGAPSTGAVTATNSAGIVALGIAPDPALFTPASFAGGAGNGSVTPTCSTNTTCTDATGVLTFTSTGTPTTSAVAIIINFGGTYTRRLNCLIQAADGNTSALTWNQQLHFSDGSSTLSAAQFFSGSTALPTSQLITAVYSCG
jgi:hypothetical protein